MNRHKLCFSFSFPAHDAQLKTMIVAQETKLHQQQAENPNEFGKQSDPLRKSDKRRHHRHHNETKGMDTMILNVTAANMSSPSSGNLAEVIFQGRVDDPLARVTTARPTIIIYPTSTSIDFLVLE